METANFNFSIVNAVFLRLQTILRFQAKTHIYLCHGLSTPFPGQTYSHGISLELAQSGKLLSLAPQTEYGFSGFH